MILVAAAILILGLLSVPSDEDRRKVAWVKSMRGADIVGQRGLKIRTKV